MSAKKLSIGILVIAFFALLGWAFFPPSSSIAPSGEEETTSSSSVSFVSSVSSKVTDPRCAQAPDPGMCKAYMPRYFFNGETCEEFIWGGCGGVVPFETMAECEEVCA